jgi:hypothetical protein
MQLEIFPGLRAKFLKTSGPPPHGVLVKRKTRWLNFVQSSARPRRRCTALQKHLDGRAALQKQTDETIKQLEKAEGSIQPAQRAERRQGQVSRVGSGEGPTRIRSCATAGTGAFRH